MTSQHNDGLDPLTWLDRVRRLVDGMHAGEPCPERHIRKAYHLVRLAPEPMSKRFPDPIEEHALEAMLADSQFDLAASSVVGSEFAAAVGEPCLRGDRSLAVLVAWAENVLQLEAEPRLSAA